MNIQQADTDKAFIYELSIHDVNKWNAHVQPGYGDDGKRTSKAECERIATLLASPPLLCAALEGLMRTFEAVLKNSEPESFASYVRAMEALRDAKGL